MFRRNKSNYYLPLFAAIVLIIFGMHFAAGMICRANPDPQVSDGYDAYLKPGVLLLSFPFLLLSKLFTNGWGPGNMAGIYIYFGAMFGYSILLTGALLGLYEGFRKVIRWKHRDKVILMH